MCVFSPHSFQVCEKLYNERRAFDKILGCYWSDPVRKPQAFTYIQHILMQSDVTADEKQKVQVEAMNHLSVRHQYVWRTRDIHSVVLARFSADVYG